MARHPGWLRHVLSDADLEAIARAIDDAEASTSAEIRVHVERHVHHPRWTRTLDALTRARDVFAHLGMHRTEHRAGVLIYLAIEDRKLAIVGDEAVHARVGDDGWARVRDLMIANLRAGATRDAIAAGVSEVGGILAAHFPRRPGDVNELSDEISVE